MKAEELLEEMARACFTEDIQEPTEFTDAADREWFEKRWGADKAAWMDYIRAALRVFVERTGLKADSEGIEKADEAGYLLYLPEALRVLLEITEPRP